MSSELATPLSTQRPKRADAARNYDKLLAAAREAFTSEGEDASLEGIARRADVGIGTLYRNFPTRQALLEAVYIGEVEGICLAAQELEGLDPWQALTGWLRRFADYATTKKALAAELMAYMDEGSEVFLHCRHAIKAAGTPLLEAAQRSGDVRPDVRFMDIVRMVGGIATIPNAEPGQVDRILAVALDGLRARSTRSAARPAQQRSRQHPRHLQLVHPSAPSIQATDFRGRAKRREGRDPDLRAAVPAATGLRTRAQTVNLIGDFGDSGERPDAGCDSRCRGATGQGSRND